jgi:hypothetical protein
MTVEAQGGPAATSSEVADLCGSILPGQFRLDAAIATGTFGTVYRTRS